MCSRSWSLSLLTGIRRTPQAPWFPVSAAAIWLILLLASHVEAAARPGDVPRRHGYPKLAVFRTLRVPEDPLALEALHRNLALADLIVFPGSRGGWWAPLPKDASGFSLRDYNRKQKILQYMGLDLFSTLPPSGSEIVPPPTDPEAAFHSHSFTREEFHQLAQIMGTPEVYPVLIPLDPKWDGAISTTYAQTDAHLATWVYANWNSRVYRDYVKRVVAEVAAAGFNGVFFDTAELYWLKSFADVWTRVPPYCFRLKSSGSWYWLTLPGQAEERFGPPPTLEAIRAMEPEALEAIADIQNCRTTGVPAELTSTADAQAMVVDFFRELRASSRMLLVSNNVIPEYIQNYPAVMAVLHGGHEEGFANPEWTPLQMRNDLQLAATLAAQRKIFIGWIRAAANDPDRLIYKYAACMIGGGKTTYCEFTEEIPDKPEIRLDPERPLENYVTLPAGETNLDRIVYRRRFSKATFYLNPTTGDLNVDGITVPAKKALVIPVIQTAPSGKAK